MATPIAGGCDALGVPSAPAVAATNTVQLNWNGQGFINANMTFYMGYVDVLTGAQLNAFLAAGVSVCVFYENDIGLGPQGALGYAPTDPEYFTYAQGVADGQDARNFASSQLGWPATRPIYYTTDFASTLANSVAIGEYFQGVASVDSCVGMYGNAGTMQSIQDLNVVNYFWQNESLGEFNNGTLWQYSSGWQVYNGGNLRLSNGDTYIDGDLAFQATGQAPGDFGQYPYGGPPSGNLTYASSVTTPTITFTQPEPQTIIVPIYAYDKVIFSDTFSASTSASTWPQVINGPTTNIGQTAYPIGNFSVDGGQTWNDYGFIYGEDWGSFYGYLPPWVVQPSVDDNGNLTFIVTYPQGGAASANFIFNIALLASYNPGVLPGTTNITQSTAFSNLVPNINPPYATYRRIAADLPESGTGTGQFAHELGTIPNLLFWQYDTSSATEIAPSTWQSSGALGTNLGVAMDSTYIYYNIDTSTNTLFLRTYLDN